MGVIAKANKAVRQIGHGIAKIGPPALIAVGGGAIGLAVYESVKDTYKSGAGTMLAQTYDNVKPLIVPAAVLITVGVAGEKAVAAAVH